MSIQKNDHHSMESILNKVEWNQQSIDSFQNSVQSNLLISVCSNATVSLKTTKYNIHITSIRIFVIALLMEVPYLTVHVHLSLRICAAATITKNLFQEQRI